MENAEMVSLRLGIWWAAELGLFKREDGGIAEVHF